MSDLINVCGSHREFTSGVRNQIEALKDLICAEIKNLKELIVGIRPEVAEVEARLNKQVDILWNSLRERDSKTTDSMQKQADKIEELQRRQNILFGGLAVINFVVLVAVKFWK